MARTRRILLTGKNGQLGWELQGALAPLGEVVALGRAEMDLASPDSIREAVQAIKPDLIVNAAAYTAVDRAEEEPDVALSVNGMAPGILAEEAKRIGAVMVHYSTDYVFDGAKSSPYVEEDDPNPMSVYGRTKLAGELNIESTRVPHITLRTSWVYGARGKNFLLTILRLARERPRLRVVDDQIGTPNWTRMLAEASASILKQCYASGSTRGGFAESGSVYHLSASGHTSWCGFARAILEEAGEKAGDRPPEVIAIGTADYPTAAKRPQNSVLANKKLFDTFGLSMPDWHADLHECLREIPRPRGAPAATA